MSIEIVGTLLFVDPRTPKSENPQGFDVPFMQQLVQLFDSCGYDRVLVPQSTHWPDSMPLATWITTVTKKLAVMVAHRPGFVTPTMAARMFATLDQLSGGRAGVHIITGGNDLELQCDGDYLTKDQRYDRSREFTGILREIWAADKPVSHSGEYFKFDNSLSQLRPYQRPSIPVYWGGKSDKAMEYAGLCADIYSLGLESLEETGQVIKKVRGYAQAAGRSIAFQGGARVILGETEEQAWINAHDVAAKLEQQQKEKFNSLGGGRSDERLSTKKATLERALAADQAQGVRVIDSCLWTGTRVASKGNLTPSFVGTPERVAEALMKYYDLGVRSLFIRGFDAPLDDIKNRGKDLIPLLKAHAAERAQQAA